MKIYLKHNLGWDLYDIERDSEELKKRNISIGDGASISDGAFIGDWASIGEGAIIGEDTYIGDRASIGDRAEFTSNPLYIIGTRHLFQQYDADKIKIGCLVKTIDEWLECYKEIGELEGYTKKEIQEYKLYLDLAKKLMK
ncbi:MAG: hypothetical protein WC248_06705 [Candidatus Methanomethylophilaceae archaeon]|jgi:carbonic anhydrase/acetyltransferase-like protein (isoleucine patch superfamily)